MNATLHEDPRALLRYVHDVVRRRCPGPLRGRSEDISQALVLRLLQRRRDADDVTLTAAYVQTAARHAVADEIRVCARRRAFWAAHGPAIEGELVDARPEPNPTCRRALGAVADHLDELDAGHRDAVMLYLQGERINDIAARLGWKPKKASNTVFRSLGRVRRRLAAQGMTAELLG
jgi:DNA-directed RNA polymerase specialized sigma24 family protein